MSGSCPDIVVVPAMFLALLRKNIRMDGIGREGSRRCLSRVQEKTGKRLLHEP
jgi:hypothetical protein